ncbi:GDSL-type esterase/lipase family protein [Aestuariivivens insulae]|uniref:GDSL-type esterase/lipase family protein n=1 Tax=Aestuariivivens insulae TaxID=1621988 RepID=UPI001F5ADB66|nr:GDSL-type esterase/lipase family protein [Aestuariivivens insulae]
MSKHFILLALFLALFSCKDNELIKIACVGDSITFGSGIANREMNAYPKQLQALLGEHYQVKNFGVSGNTLLKKGDRPYWNSDAYQEALAFNPDVVFIKLGTNDSKQQNRVYLETDFETDYKALIQSFKERNSNVRVVLLLPIPSFLKDSTSIWDPVIKNKIIPLTQKVAYETNSELIDLYQLFIDSPNLLPDTIHPSSLGATRIARRIYEAVTQDISDHFNITLDRFVDKQVQNFHGYRQTNFKWNGIDCKIVEPKFVTEERPWVMRARFWGHEPQTDIALLERGFHIAYCDVANLYGAPEAVSRWDAFYEFMTTNGFSKKVILEGMSRGGLMVYNWAEKNPEKVACIYADAPVLEVKSWPKGDGIYKGSPEDWEQLKQVYGLVSDSLVATFQGDPIHKTKSIASAGIPMLHVCGLTDSIVPADENTEPFVRAIQHYGGQVEAIYKENNGHHPHSLKNPTPIVDFILRATNRKINFAVLPAPGSEYRSGAGWKKSKGWWSQMKDIDSLCQATKDIDLLLIGNSITQGWGGNRTFTTHKPGQAAADNYFKDLKWISAGISGDRTEHVLWRIKNGHYNYASPKLVVLTIGVNNFPFNTAQEISAGIIKVVALTKATFPKSKLLLLGPLPTGLDKNSDRRKKYNDIHESIQYLGDEPSVYYYNLEQFFSDDNGNLKEQCYSGDGIHLKSGGYSVWGQFIRERYDELIK